MMGRFWNATSGAMMDPDDFIRWGHFSNFGLVNKLQKETLKSLANQKRLEILQLLNQQELSVLEMISMLGIPQTNLSQHLSVLRSLRLVTTRKEGVKVYYRLTDKPIAMVINQLREF